MGDKDLAHDLQTCVLCHFLDAAYTLWLMLSSIHGVFTGVFLNHLFIQHIFNEKLLCAGC